MSKDESSLENVFPNINPDSVEPSRVEQQPSQQRTEEESESRDAERLQRKLTHTRLLADEVEELRETDEAVRHYESTGVPGSDMVPKQADALSQGGIHEERKSAEQQMAQAVKDLVENEYGGY
ncbi:MAG: hypothetical protein ABEI13_02250, partial [Candidatus Paceibacteria bacterium]